jgi:hypothetical protein
VELLQQWPERYEAHLIRVLNDPGSPRRSLILNLEWPLPRPCPRLIELLLSQARDPRTLQSEELVAFLAKGGEPETEALLEAIFKDRRYSPRLRREAKLQLARWFGTNLLAIDIELAGLDDQKRSALPVPLDVIITNRSGGTLNLAYEDSAQILELYAKLDGQHLLPRCGGAALQALTPRRCATRVTLEPWEQHTLRINLADHLAIPDDAVDASLQLEVTVTCRIPGAHQAPQEGPWVELKLRR